MAQNTYSDEARNAKAGALANLLNGGTLRLRNGTTTLADIALDGTNAFEAAGTGSAGIARALGDDGTNPIGGGNPLTGTGGAGAGSGTDCDNFQLLTSGGLLRAGGDAGVAGSGAGGTDPALVLVNASIANGQPIQVTDLRIEEPATVDYDPNA